MDSELDVQIFDIFKMGDQSVEGTIGITLYLKIDFQNLVGH